MEKNRTKQLGISVFMAVIMFSMILLLCTSADVYADNGENAEDEGVISVMASGDEGVITAVWSEEESADYYLVYLDDDTTARRFNAAEERICVFEDVDKSVLHTVTVGAYAVEEVTPGDPDPSEEIPDPDILIATGSAFDVSAMIREKIQDQSIVAARIGGDLKNILNESDEGHAVAQGSATDGVYAYYLLNCSSTEKGRFIKMKLENKEVVATGPVINIHHGNGVTYDTKRGLLVVVGYGEWRKQLTFVDPVSLEIVSERNISYPYRINGVSSENAYENGIRSIAYIAEFDVYLGTARKDGDAEDYNNIWVFDAETLEAIGHVIADVNKQYPVRYQDIDADEKYVYYLLSPGEGQSKNIILALDWNSEMLLPVMNGEKEYVEDTWICNNDGSGKPDAVITLSLTHESEGIFHTFEENGDEHFFVSQYYGRYIYKTVRTKKKYKVRWKKVWEKVRWKRVRVNGRYKWKYRWKRVWKYRTKTKTIKKKVRVRRSRQSYAYDIGII